MVGRNEMDVGVCSGVTKGAGLSEFEKCILFRKNDFVPPAASYMCSIDM